jgi:hypothetical protein
MWIETPIPPAYGRDNLWRRGEVAAEPTTEGLGGNARASRVRSEMNRVWKGASKPEIYGFPTRTRFHPRIGFLFLWRFIEHLITGRACPRNVLFFATPGEKP